MSNAALLVIVLGLVLAYILVRGFQYQADEQYGSYYHLWSIRTDENEPSYLGRYAEEDEMIRAVKTALQDNKTETIIVRNANGNSREFTRHNVGNPLS